jgi:hypothetical protein
MQCVEYRGISLTVTYLRVFHGVQSVQGVWCSASFHLEGDTISR